MFSNNQESYINTFTQEFMRELKFIADVARGRSQARPSFFDQIIGKISFGSNLLSAITGFFPAAAVIGSDGQVAVYVVMGFQYLYEYNMNNNIESVITSTKQPELLLLLLIEGVAREAARRHEFFLNNMCDPESIDLFAIVGVARILQYLSDNVDITFTAENLIKGLIEGKSGVGQQGFKNNQLKCKHSIISAVSAETVYANSAQMNLEGKYYVKEKIKQYFRSNDPHYVKMLEDTAKKLPKAGVIFLSNEEISTYKYLEETISDELDEHLCHYRPGYRILNRSDIESYISAQKSSRTPLSLTEYCGNKGVICRDDLSGLNLEGADFSNVDFSGVKFGIKEGIKTKLNHASFEKAYLVSVDLSQAEAIHVNFRHSTFSLVNAEEALLNDSDFTAARIFYSCFTRSELKNINYIGAEWSGSDLSTAITNAETSSELIQLCTTTQALLEKYTAQENSLTVLEKMIRQNKEDQDSRVKKSVAVKLQRLQKKVLDDEEMKAELDLYIPVQASFPTSKQPFDLEEKTLEFLSSDKRVMLLLGGAGEGKSTFNRYMHRKLWSQFTENGAIPLFISLPTIINPATQLLQEYFHSEYFTEEEIIFLHSEHSFVLILDGYDEMNTTPNLYATNRLSNWQAKILISCRTQYLTQFVRYDQYFKPIQAERVLGNLFQELVTIPFNDQQVDHYIAKYLTINTNEDPPLSWHTVEEYRTYINTISGLKDLVTNPFLLMITLKVMPDIVAQYDTEQDEGIKLRITQTALYDAFMQYWFRRGEIKVLLSTTHESIAWHDITAEFQSTSEELAKEMFHAGIMQVRYRTSEQVSGLSYENYFTSYELISTTLAELEQLALEEAVMRLVFVQDATKPEEKWRISARNNAGGPTYHPKTGWLMVSELARRWSARDQSKPEHQEKLRALDYAWSILSTHTPETLSPGDQQAVFHAILLGLTHPWEKFFNLDALRVRQILPGVPVKNTGRGGYAFIHAEILTHFAKKAIKREELQLANPMKVKKPWEMPLSTTTQGDPRFFSHAQAGTANITSSAAKLTK